MIALVGLRGRLVAAVTILSLATLGAALEIVSLVFARQQQQKLDDALVAVAMEEARELRHQATAGQRVRDRPGPVVNDSGPHPLYAALYDDKAAVLSATKTFGSSVPFLSALPKQYGACFNLRVGPAHLRAVIVPVAHDDKGRSSVKLLAAAPRSDLEGDIALLRQAMLVVFGVAVAWTVVLALWMISRLTRHHRVIVATSKKVAEGDLSARVELAGNDDVAQLGQAIDGMIDRLSLLLQSQQQFIAHAAHELRSPVTTLYGELTNILRRSRSPQEYRAAVDAALDSTRRLKDLMEDLLSLARLGADDHRRQVSAVLDQAVRDALESVQSELRNKSICMVPEIPSLRVVGRAADLTRMFRNLIENAVRHSPAGGKLTVRAECREREAIIHVCDEGSGVSSKDSPRIFEPFYRASEVRARSTTGAGLGLSIARDIARLYGGDIVLVRDQVPGAHFIVSLKSANESA